MNVDQIQQIVDYLYKNQYNKLKVKSEENV
jgi:hypothetical protein